MSMISNYFKTALRNLWKNRTYGFLNIGGLAIGITCAALIFLWVEDEVNYNRHHSDLPRLGKIMEHQTYDGKTFTFGATPGPLAPAMQTEIPGIEHVARTNWGGRTLFTIGEKSIYEQGLYMDSSFFLVFDFPFIRGNAAKPFTGLHSVVLSESMAKRFFGSAAEAYGKMIKVDNDQDYLVSGVFRDLPRNASFKFDWGIPFAHYLKANPWLSSWGSNGIQTFTKIAQGADLATINRQLFGYIKSKDDNAIARPFIFPMPQWRLYSKFEDGKQAGGRIEYVRLFTIIAWIILVIACINFMNLATARSEQRAREVGVRKVLGAGKRSLIGQFLGESLVMAFFSILLAIGMIYIFLKPFNALVEKDLMLQLSDPLHLFSLLGIGAICGLVAGSYPALYLSSFNPITVLKGLKLRHATSAGLIRKGLVITQFSISIILIIGTIIIYQQVEHIKTRQLGYDKDRLIIMDMQGRMTERYDLLRQQLLSTGSVESVAASSSQLLQLTSNGDSFEWEGKDPDARILITNEWVTPEYIGTMRMKLKEGRDFGPVPKNDSANIIINESFARLMKKDQVAGTTLQFNGQPVQVIGVVEDFVYTDMYAPAAPAAFFSAPANASYFFIRLKEGRDVQQSLAKVEGVMKSVNPGYPFEYKFVDDEFDKLFKSEMLIGKLSRIFAVLAILISCLGLFGLAAYTAERRTKEIGIRKVLGASTSGIATLLSRDFLKLVCFSFVIAFPVAWYFMNRWLQDFAYRIDISYFVFVMAGVLAILIAIITISFQAVRAAVANPVKSLRTE